MNCQYLCKQYKRNEDHHTKELFGENDDNQKPKLVPKPLCKKSHIYTPKDDELEISNQSIQTITYTMSE